MLVDRVPLTTTHDQAASGGDDLSHPSAPNGAAAAAAADRIGLVVATGIFGMAALLGLVAQAVLPTPAALAAGSGAGVVVALATGRRFNPAVIAGLAWYVLCSALTVGVLAWADTDQHTVTRTLTVAAGFAMTLALDWCRRQPQQGQPVAAAIGQAARVFTRPTNGLPALLIGAGLTAPLIGTYAPLIGDPDSAYLVSSTLHVRQHGIGLLQETQEVFVPHLTLSPLLALDGYRAAVLFSLLNLTALTALTAYLGYRLTNRGAGALAAAAALLTLPAIVERADRLPMYAASYFFAYGAGWLLHRSMAEPDRSRWLPVGAGLAFVLAFESHGVGQVFLLTPFLLLLLHPWSRARHPLLLCLATIMVASIPRAVANLSVGGLTAIRASYADFLVQKYMTTINQDFWGQSAGTSPSEYVTNLPGMAKEAMGSHSLLALMLVPVVVAAWRSGRRALAFTAISGGIFLAALVVKGPGTYGRYLTPLAVGLALVVAVGVVYMRRGGPLLVRWLGGLLLLTLSVVAVIRLEDRVTISQAQEDVVTQGPWQALASAVDDDQAVLGVRSHQLLWLDPSLPTAYGRIMDEEDWVTYLSWPSDDEVIEMMDRNDIGWLYVMPERRLEVGYHESWLLPEYGLRADHVQHLLQSDRFCLVTEDRGHLLFRQGACQPGDHRVVPQPLRERFLGPTPPS